MAGLRTINVNGFGELFADRKRKKSSDRLIERATLSTRRSGIDGAVDGLASRDELAMLRMGSNDAASRQHVEVILEELGSEQMAAITSPGRPEVLPDLVMRSENLSSDLQANTVVYQQASSGIPVFGSRLVVDVDQDDKSLVAVNGKLAPPPLNDALATISPADAWQKLVGWAQPDTAPDAPALPPALTWYVDDNEQYSLTYRFKAVPMSPAEASGDPVDVTYVANPCVRHSFGKAARAYDYFVDAQSGDVRYYFSSSPNFIPSPMKGKDCFGQERAFHGFNTGGTYALRDPQRNIETFDYNFNDLDNNPMPPIPASPMSFPTFNVDAASPAAVSAHWHATLVFDFFNNVLKRKGVDDKGMKLVSVVNVYSSDRNPLPPPQWGNAAWWQNIMWYGQEDDGTGTLVSFSKHLDVIAHELTHGVTSTSSNLIYRDLPGALNESFSDIFGIFVANWYPQQPNPVTGWNWLIGPGLGNGGGPLRNFADPAAAGQPAHMNQYRPLPESHDHGGVHIYSGIHNKAVHGLLTALDGPGNPIIPTAEAALLLYLTLTRLTPTSNFSDARRTLLTIAGVYYANHGDRDHRISAIEHAYAAVGIV